MNPILNKHPLTESDAIANVVKPVLNDSTDDEYTVEAIKKRRVKHGVEQYFVKWAGYNNKHNTWIGLDDMECDDLIAEFEGASGMSAHVKTLCILRLRLLYSLLRYLVLMLCLLGKMLLN